MIVVLTNMHHISLLQCDLIVRRTNMRNMTLMIWHLNRVFGTWPTTLLAANMNKVTIEGPVCDSSQVMGWHLRNMNNETDTITPLIHISSFILTRGLHVHAMHIVWDQ